ALGHAHGVAGAHRRRRDVDDLAVDGDRTMADELPRFRTRRAEAHPVDDVIQPRFEQLQQVRAGRALALRGALEVQAELALEDAVRAAQLLLFAKLVAVIRRAHARLDAVLSRLGVQLALGVERSTRAFQEKVSAFPSRQLAFGSGVTSHVFAVLKGLTF